MKEIFSLCEVPSLSSATFLKVQDEVNDVIHDTLLSEIKSAGEEKKLIALQKGRVDADGIPYITVIANGAWSKRSYKVNYSALSEVVSYFSYLVGDGDSSVTKKLADAKPYPNRPV